ncbi:MAG: helix-turn-helix domain-containing protein [Actinomycetota bacterium]
MIISSMEREVPIVKSPSAKRRYDASSRRASAERLSETIVAAARRMLLSDGYAPTTIPRIAAECRVSVESVYKRVPGKPALVRAVVEQALRGAGTVPAETRSDAIPTDDLAALLRGWGQLTAEVAPRVAPVLLLVRDAAAQDRGLAELACDLDESRRSRMSVNASRLKSAGHLPKGMSVKQAADVLWTYSSPELFELLVIRRRWSLAHFATFVARGIAAQLAAD